MICLKECILISLLKSSLAYLVHLGKHYTQNATGVTSTTLAQLINPDNTCATNLRLYDHVI